MQGYKILDQYLLDLSQSLGSGQYGNVYKGYYYIQDENSEKREKTLAIKETPCYQATSEESNAKKLTAISEIKFLKEIDHPNIIKFIDAKKTQHNIYLIMEYCNQGDLSRFLIEKCKQSPNGVIREMDVLSYFRDIIDAFRYLRNKDILHRDIKTQNILVHDGVLKLADFGFSRKVTDEACMNTQTGTPLFQDPNIIEENYNSKSDIFSLGILLWHMLYIDYNNPNSKNSYPWYEKTVIRLNESMRKNPVQFPQRENRPVSDQTKDLIRKMLEIDLDKRISWEELFSHPLLQSKIENSVAKQLASVNKSNNIIGQQQNNVDNIDVKTYSVINNQNLIEQERPENMTIKMNKNRENKRQIMEPAIKRLIFEKDMIQFIFSTASRLRNFIFPLLNSLKTKENTFLLDKQAWEAFCNDDRYYNQYLLEAQQNLQICFKHFEAFYSKAKQFDPNDDNINDSQSLLIHFSQGVIETTLKCLLPPLYEVQEKLINQQQLSNFDTYWNSQDDIFTNITKQPD
ncbi:Protein kinase-like domain [Pseudocohnilembus persalinus]|uniref:Protein kinase-like domain n=1 Tax=Pseudocohnilembus persalinus TaxID=266149 RepID=A0A0V0QEM4_PSEPJ|nr:Protein kinase-like domain [Pseudocohnilembus persalinus]|eukprot:KRX00607.1 Protein kinase-like domain [Pseudocohnilembus persalinus]